MKGAETKLADRQDYTIRRIIWETREYVALALAWWDVSVQYPVPVLGEPLPILETDNRGCRSVRCDSYRRVLALLAHVAYNGSWVRRVHERKKDLGDG